MATTTLVGHKAPLFFCAPGCKDDYTENVKASFAIQSITTSSPSIVDFPAAWPPGTQLSVKILHGQKVHGVIEQIIKRTALSWLDGVSDSLSLNWVKSDQYAEIRISFCNTLPNWSCVGARALSYGQDKATMNFAFGGWTDRHMVFTHSYIERSAAHLFGHALGLPHALTQWPTPWNDSKLQNQFGPFFTSIIQEDHGDPRLQSPYSVMRFDRPADLGTSGVDELRGNSAIDAEDRQALQKLYPKNFGAYMHRIFATDITGWQFGIGKPVGKRSCSTKETANTITALSMLEIGLNGNFRVKSFVQNIQKRSSFEAGIGTWADTDLFNASCSVLSFDEDDQRVQTGRIEFINVTSSANSAPGGGMSTNVRFSRPFKKAPKIATFISSLDTKKGANIRISVFASNIDRDGFTLTVKTWADTILYSVGASWLAHEADDWSIRSGIFNNPQHMTLAKEDRYKQAYSSPMRRIPTTMFHGFTHIDVPGNSPIRLRLDTPFWDESQVEGWSYTWHDESKYDCVRGSYIAIL